MASGIVYEARHTDGRTYIGATTRSLAEYRRDRQQKAVRKSRSGESLSEFEAALAAEPDAFTWYVLAIAPSGRQLADAKQRAIADLDPSLNGTESFGPLALVALRPETMAEIDLLAERTGLTQRRLLREAVETGVRAMRRRHRDAVDRADKTMPAIDPVAPPGEDE